MYYSTVKKINKNIAYPPKNFLYVIVKKIVVLLLVLISSILCSESVYAQRKNKNYRKNNRSFYQRKYSTNHIKADKQCGKLRAKKIRKKNKHVAARGQKKAKSQSLAEVDINDIPPKPAPKPKPKPPVTPVASVEKKPDIDNLNLDEKHEVEDEVLKKNNLPAPTSAKHEQIRKEVEKHLSNFENEKPIKLDPLYFVTGQDEFAFVDMDPFLVAVEYALQGKMILIEGHTDHVGDFDANVALSIKRVERIRDLMVQMGVHDDKISVVGYGEEQSQEANDTTKKQEERRVDFTVF